MLRARLPALQYGSAVGVRLDDAQIERIAALVSARPEVNHNYQREHSYNLWFVATAADPAALAAALAAKNDVLPRRLDVNEVQRGLIAQGAELRMGENPGVGS